LTPALDLLLTGRSIAAQAAVDLGVFDRVVPSADLLKEAKAVARALRGQTYDAAKKYPKLARLEVPPHDAVTARELARQHGVSDEEFARYPAYSAIVDSVLKGARLPLAEATAVEMHQFLRLMFDPVAGRMIRALFLERLRADRELAAPAGVNVRRIKTGKISAAMRAWADALGKLKIPVEVDVSLLGDTIAAVGVDDKVVRVRLGVVEAVTAANDATVPVAILSPLGAYGRVVEIVGGEVGDLPLLKALATQLRSLPWPTPGPTSVLQALHGTSLPDQASVALMAAARAGAGDPAFLDVAACLSGVTAAWSGGPLAWLWGEQTSMVARFDAETKKAWVAMEPALRRACM
jgi:3-hydroxyacyl-CoA dehydrogenase / enoyl-CoA hydratase / 3-hydroxybutyryl-CoA epimerase